MAVGLGTLFLGYWLASFGYYSLRGPGVGLIDLIVPGREITIPSSGGTAAPIPQGPRGNLKRPLGNGAAPPELGKDPNTGLPVPFA